MDKNWRPEGAWVNPYAQSIQKILVECKGKEKRKEKRGGLTVAFIDKSSDAFEEGASAIIPYVRQTTVQEIISGLKAILREAGDLRELERQLIDYVQALRTEAETEHQPPPEQRKEE